MHYTCKLYWYRPITETGSCFSEPASTSGSGKTASTSTEGMTHSCVFRPGDYDVVTGPDEYISVQKKDYTLPSERELPTSFGAGISTKTKNPKSHITERLIHLFYNLAKWMICCTVMIERWQFLVKL